MTKEHQPPLLEVKGLVKSYGGRRVVNHLSFSIGEGELVGLLGPNGAGKTTAFYMTIGLIAPEEGSVFFNGHEVTNLSIDRRAKLGMGYLAQEPSVFGSLTVEQNILAILELMQLNKDERQARLESALSELHLSPLRKKKAASLSGGERRRLEISRSLVTNPRCLLLDEPFANIDPISVDEVKELMRHLARRGISVLITDHNAREIFSVVDRSYLIYDGKVLAEGGVQTLLSDQRVRSFYLGDKFSM